MTAPGVRASVSRLRTGGLRSGRRPVGHNVGRVGVTLALAFVVLAAGAGYWQVWRAQELSTTPDDPAVIAAARHVVRGQIKDRTGTVLASSKKDANGEPYRVYTDRSMSPVIGYASRFFGTSGVEHTYDGELTGVLSPDPVQQLLAKFQGNRADPQDLTLTISLRLQRAAQKALGNDKGAVVMLDPSTGEVLALVSGPTYDASPIANPTTAQKAFASLKEDKDKPLLDRAVQGLYVPGSTFKIVTSIAALSSGAITTSTTYPQQPRAETTGLLVSGYRVRDGHHPFTDGRALNYPEAVEVSCNIYFALTGLRTGGEKLADWAGRLGFGHQIPFDLPTEVSQVTNGGGRFGGGFKDAVELANASYGQAEVLATPLQMALVAATVANDGVLMKPHLVRSFSSDKGGTRTVAPQQMADVLTPDVAGEIKSAMERAVEGDFGKLFTPGAAVPGIPTAGKTGTAQLGAGEPHSWFIGFAPVDQPKIVVAVIVENAGHGASRAAPMAGDLMKLFFDTLGK
jgi:peptidoglycan glycosyltransferase